MGEKDRCGRLWEGQPEKKGQSWTGRGIYVLVDLVLAQGCPAGLSTVAGQPSVSLQSIEGPQIHSHLT